MSNKTGNDFAIGYQYDDNYLIWYLSRKAYYYYTEYYYINEQIYNSIKVYPNPSKDIIYINCGEFEANQLVVFSTSGKLILNKSIHNRVERIDVSKYPPGFYLIEISNNTHKVHSKILKQ